MANTRLSDLNQHLFDQLERLSDTSLDADAIEREVKRTDAIVEIADQVTQNSRTMLAAAKLYAEHGQHVLQMLPQIGGPTKDAEASE